MNGREVDPTAPQLSAFDRGLTLGDGVFETLRMYQGVVFRAQAHLDRLARGAHILRIDLPGDLAAQLEHAARESAASGLANAAVRLTVTRGPGHAGLATPAHGAASVILAIGPLPQYPTSIYEHGITARTGVGRRNEHAVTVGMKTIAYADGIIALRAARDAGADDAVLLDTAGHVSEATFSNLFAYIDGELVTPPLSCGVLPGITRAAVIDLARELALRPVEQVLEPSALAGASEAFLTSSLREIAPLVRLDDDAIGSGRVGPITRTLAQAYADLVRQDQAP